MQQLVLLPRPRAKALVALCLTLMLIASSCYADVNSVEVFGVGECSDCKQTTNAVSGLRVTIDCKVADGNMKTRGVGQLDKHGKFKVSLPSEMLTENGEMKEECFAQLRSASSSVSGPCPHGIVEASKLIFKSKNKLGKHTFVTKGKLSISSSVTCASATFWPPHKYPPLPKMPPHPWFKPLPPHPWFKPLPPHPWFKHIPPPAPVPIYKPPTVSPPNNPLPPTPVPIYKPPTVTPPVYHKPPPVVEHPPVHKKPCPPPVPEHKPTPTPTPVPVPVPVPVPEHKPTPTPTPVVPVPVPVPVYKPHPPMIPQLPPIIKKPCPPLPPIIKKPCPPLPPMPKISVPPFPKIPPKYFHHHPKFGSWPPHTSSHP